MASIWKGSLTFGLVSMPVHLQAAVREDHISFRMLHSEDLSPVKYERVCQSDGEPVPWSEIVKGYEYEKGKYVVMSDEDFRAAALETSDAIEILDFVREDEIDPRYFETPYYLVPGKGADVPYALLREAIRQSQSVGVGKIVLRQKQHIAAVKALGDALVLELMRFQHELVDPAEYRFPTAERVRPQELKMAEQLIANLAGPFDPSKYNDEYRANLMRVIRAKMKGKKVKAAAEPERAPEDAQVVDLMERLRRSLGETGKRGSGRVRAGGGKRRGAAAKERPGKSQSA
jgi:DNA end-binding protein Ku